MPQFLGYGSGSDGSATLSGTYAPIDSSCSGTSGTTSLTATNTSFSAGQFIFIHQSRGAGAGNWEVNKISSYVAGTITTVHPLDNTYTDSGSSQAQVIVMPQYSDLTVSGTLTASAWDGDTGGIIPLMCSGLFTVSGTITATGKGFRGGAAVSGAGATPYQGEGHSGTGSQSHLANGNGGGAGQNETGLDGISATGGYGGNILAGQDGFSFQNGSGGGSLGHTSVSGDGGALKSEVDMTPMVFGGGGGAGGGLFNGTGTAGGDGGGIVIIFARTLEVTGSIEVEGTAGESIRTGMSGGNGGGGLVFVKSITATLGSSFITAGVSGIPRIESCSITGTTSPTASESEGGHSWCGSLTFIM